MSARHKVVLDTSLYIDWINRGERQELFTTHLHQRYLSAVVWMELRAGATTPKAIRGVERLAAVYGQLGRIVAPPAQVWGLAGGVVDRLRRRGFEARRASLVNDVLVALTARSLGAAVLTADADFQAIQRIERFALEIMPAA